MNKKKLILLLVLIFLFTGCSATYELEVYNNKFKENVSINNYDPKSWDTVLSTGFSYKRQIMDNLKYPLPAFSDTTVDENDWIRLDGEEYYETKLISSKNNLGLSWNYNFNDTNYSRAKLPSMAYQYFTFTTSNENTWILSTDAKLKSFEEYSNLEKLTIKIKTNHKVINHNADKVEGTTYTWNILRENQNKKRVQIELSKEEKVFNYENEIVNTVGIVVAVVLGIAILGISVIILFKWRQARRNRI